MQSSSCRAGKWQMRLPWWSLCWDRVAEYSNIPENSETTVWSALKKKMWPSDLHGFDVRPCGNEPAKPSSPKKTVGLRQETHDSNRAIPEYWHISAFRASRNRRASTSGSTRVIASCTSEIISGGVAEFI